MILKELINKSVYGTIGYINSQESINQLESYIQYNLPILQEFQSIIVATNFSSLEWKESYEVMWRSYFPECILITSSENRGHNHGYVDLDNLLFNHCKENNIKWLCKSANDTIMTQDLLNKQVSESDFYYFMSIGYGWLLEKYGLDLDKFIDDDYFYPNTNFYFISVSKTDYLNDKQYADETYEYIKSLPEYNGRIWEYIDGWSCELFLKQCVERNNLKKEHLIPDEKYISLLDSVKQYNIHDCSHKNIMIEGVCHFHFPEQNVLYI